MTLQSAHHQNSSLPPKFQSCKPGTAFLVETSRKEGFVALAEGRGLVALQVMPSKDFLLQAAYLLADRSLGYVAVGIGPGSYTGTRTGISFAQGLSFALQVPLIGFYSPLAYLPKRPGPFALLLPAKQGATCLLTGECDARSLLFHSHPKLLEKEELASHLLPSHLKVESETALLNLSHLLPYLLKRFTLKEYNPMRVVEASYLYSI